jgi:hypothetical protein
LEWQWRFRSTLQWGRISIAAATTAAATTAAATTAAAAITTATAEVFKQQVVVSKPRFIRCLSVPYSK